MDRINELIKNASSVAVIGHVRPDGDCVGSCLALQNYLKDTNPDLRTDVFLGAFSDVFRFLKGADEIRSDFETKEAYDLCISLDASDLERLGEGRQIFEAAKRTVCLDHHVTNPGFAQTNHVEPDTSSTSEVLFYLFDYDKISIAAAECLYVGIIHDTGVFKHSNTTQRTMQAGGMLIDKGINHSQIIDDTFYKKSYVQNQILGRALMESVVFLEKKCIFSVIKQKDMVFYGVNATDLDGIVDQLRITEGIEVAIFLYEMEAHVYKVSMRSNHTVDVSRVASYFGGGGHKKAAGCTITGSVYDVINNLSQQIVLQLPLESGS